MNLFKNPIAYAVSAILFPMALIAQQHNASDVSKVKQIADEVRLAFAPDKRSALFELKTDESNANKHVIETTDARAKDKFLERIRQEGISDDITFRVLPDETVAGNSNAVVRLSVVDIRYTPANQAEMVTQALLGTPLDLLKKQGDYYLVRTPEGYIAWLKGASLTPMDDDRYRGWQASEKLMFTDDFGHAFTQADKKSQRISDLVMGNLLQLEGVENGFYKVQYPDGRKAYVAQEQAQPYSEWLASASLSAENVLNIAKSMIGVPYLWGGTSNKGVDCSGFTKTSFYMNGLVIPRDASQQVNSGLEIDILTEQEVDRKKVLENLKPADLLFFAERKGQAENPRVTHVALYMGNGEFIHASGLVRINSLFEDSEIFDAHQARTLVGARRYIGQSGTAGLVPMDQHSDYAQN